MRRVPRNLLPDSPDMPHRGPEPGLTGSSCHILTTDPLEAEPFSIGVVLAPEPTTEEGMAVARRAKDLFFEMEARSYDGGPDKTCSRY